MRFRLPSAAVRLSAAGVGVAALVLAGALLWLQFGPTSTPTASAAQVTIAVRDNRFCGPSPGCDSDTKINVGDSVEWVWDSTINSHTTTECGASCNNPTNTPLWDSPVQSSGTYKTSFTFDQPGTYLYRCEVHPFSMRGTIIVNGDPPTATPVTPSPTPTKTPMEPTPSPTNTPPQATATPVPTNTPPGPGTPTKTPMEPTPTPTDLPPTPTPTKQPNGDTDNDGCLDTRENGPDETLGGRRDYLNFWDFFDPNRDRAVGLPDFLAVLRHFGTAGDPLTLDPDAPEPPPGEYWASADRGGQAPGGDPWDELPANGSVTFGDFLSVLRQFGHNCA